MGPAMASVGRHKPSSKRRSGVIFMGARGGARCRRGDTAGKAVGIRGSQHSGLTDASLLPIRSTKVPCRSVEPFAFLAVKSPEAANPAYPHFTTEDTEATEDGTTDAHLWTLMTSIGWRYGCEDVCGRVTEIRTLPSLCALVVGIFGMVNRRERLDRREAVSPCRSLRSLR